MTQMDVQPPGLVAGTRPVIDMRGISIDFGGVPALADVDLRLFPGEVHALMGENGAGKSTLIKALTGVYAVDAGTIAIDGVEHRFSSPAESQAAGISTVYQEVNLVPNLTVAENMLLGREPRRWGGFRRRYRAELEDHEDALRELARLARGGDVTLVFGARDHERNNAVVLRERLEELAD